MANSKFGVSVVIPTYNAINLLKNHLPSVFSVLKNGDEVIIVDDASTDNSVDWLVDKFSLRTKQKKVAGQTLATKVGNLHIGTKKIRLQVVLNKRNLRYARSVNRGAAVAANPLLLMLNNDVRPHAGLRESLVQHFKKAAVFGVACLEINTHQGMLKSGRNLLWFDRGMFHHSANPDLSFGENAWVTGGSGMFRKSMWQELGGFDVDFHPAYWEDIDLSFRAKKRGWKVLFEPNAVVDHNHETTNKDVFGERGIQQISWRAAHIFVQKNGSWWQRFQHWLWRPYWIVKYRRWQQSLHEHIG